MSDDRREYDWNVAERMRYKVVTPPGEVDEERSNIRDARTHTGDTVQEYYDGALIREHILTVRREETFDPRGQSNGLSPVAHFDTHWRVDAAAIAKLPQAIVNGRWSDPVADCQAGRGLRRSAPVGAWGVYAPDFTDAYTRGEIAPLLDRYKRLRQAIEAGNRVLYAQERVVRDRGLFDNLPEVKQEVRAWIDECETKVRAAHTLCADALSETPAQAPRTHASTVAGPRSTGRLLAQLRGLGAVHRFGWHAMRGYRYSMPLEICEPGNVKGRHTHVRWTEEWPLVQALGALRPWHDWAELRDDTGAVYWRTAGDEKFNEPLARLQREVEQNADSARRLVLVCCKDCCKYVR
jgi:hypothetical protein